jgi:DNA-binding transcriptional ArsR family regulator
MIPSIMRLNKSPLCISLGETSTLQLLSFFIAHRDFDYSKTELAKNIEMSRQSIYKALEPLLKYKMVIESRKIGNTTLYKLNNDSEPLKAIKHFNDTIIKMIVDNEIDKDIKKEEDIKKVIELFRMERNED